jgi:oligopeptide transport system substrate-binding protein
MRLPPQLLPISLLFAMLFLAGCGEIWNDPYPVAERGKNILYSVFAERPKHLDPAQSYASDEAIFTRQIYEPPLQYHYLKRPYELIPLTAAEIPKPRFEEKGGATYSIYDIRIKPGIKYQPHPGFVPENSSLISRKIKNLKTPYDLPLGARELKADDYIYQIKRLAHPQLHSPIFSLMAEYIVGLKEYAAVLKKADKPGQWLDLRKYDIEGVTRIDDYTYRVTLKGRYPQFVYWLAMPFFASMPWEADQFFAQPGMAEKNFTLDWWPVGSGPFMLRENDPNSRMVMERNPNFRGEAYPSEGDKGDAEAGLLADAGKTMPFVDKAVYTREREGIPLWNKFLQGYYDLSGISSDNFDQAVRVSLEGETGLSPEMEARGIQLSTSIGPTVFYLGVNMLDPVIGQAGGERARKVRQALAIAVDWEEFLSVFRNGRGVPSHGPVPPGIFGFREDKDSINPVTHELKDGRVVRRPIEAARKLLAEAGYPDGRDAKTGQPLVLYLDTTQRGPEDKAMMDWWRKQFAKISVQFEPRQTDWNRFQEKLRKGSTQLFIVGWSADYPDPENFMFLLYGPQSRAKTQGENASNYVNPEFDKLFEKMRNMPNSPERQQLIDRMTEIFRRDAPWIGGFHPKNFALFHSWLGNAKANEMSDNKLKYLKVEPAKREPLRRQWNPPIVWPIVLVVLILIISVIPAIRAYRRRERMAARPAAV